MSRYVWNSPVLLHAWSHSFVDKHNSLLALLVVCLIQETLHAFGKPQHQQLSVMFSFNARPCEQIEKMFGSITSFNCHSITTV